MTLRRIDLPFWHLVAFLIRLFLASVIAGLVVGCIVGAIGAAGFAVLTVLLMLLAGGA